MSDSRAKQHNRFLSHAQKIKNKKEKKKKKEEEEEPSTDKDAFKTGNRIHKNKTN